MEKKEANKERNGVKISINCNNSNIGGLIVWGGILAVTSLTAAFIVQTRRRNSSSSRDHAPNSKQKQDQEDNEVCKTNKGPGLAALTATTPPSIPQQNLCVTGDDKCELLCDKTPNLEANLTRLSCGRNETANVSKREIFISDDTKPESKGIESGRGSGKVEEISSKVPDDAGTSLYEVDDKTQHDKESPLIEMLGAVKFNEAVHDSREAAAQEILLRHSVGGERKKAGSDGDDVYDDHVIRTVKEENDDSDDNSRIEEEPHGDYIVEDREAGSEGTEGSSPDSSLGKIWPAELVEALSTGIKNAVKVQQELRDKIGDECNETLAKTEVDDHESSSRTDALDDRGISDKTVSTELEKKETSQLDSGAQTADEAISTEIKNTAPGQEELATVTEDEGNSTAIKTRYSDQTNTSRSDEYEASNEVPNNEIIALGSIEGIADVDHKADSESEPLENGKYDYKSRSKAVVKELMSATDHIWHATKRRIPVWSVPVLLLSALLLIHLTAFLLLESLFPKRLENNETANPL